MFGLRLEGNLVEHGLNISYIPAMQHKAISSAQCFTCFFSYTFHMFVYKNETARRMDSSNMKAERFE